MQLTKTIFSDSAIFIETKDCRKSGQKVSFCVQKKMQYWHPPPYTHSIWRKAHDAGTGQAGLRGPLRWRAV